MHRLIMELKETGDLKILKILIELQHNHIMKENEYITPKLEELSHQ